MSLSENDGKSKLEAAAPIPEVTRALGISEATYYVCDVSPENDDRSKLE